MEYSSEQLAKAAGISARTLHYYDAAGLLSPAMRMAGGRRIYGMEQMLVLVDILYYKKLGFSLNKIKQLLAMKQVSRKAALEDKKQFLLKEIQRLQDLVHIIDNTPQLPDAPKTNPADLIKQFELLQKKSLEYRKDFEKKFGQQENAEVPASIGQHEQKYDEIMRHVDKHKYREKAAACVQKMLAAVEDGADEGSQKVQAIMQEYHELIRMIRPVSKKDFLKIAMGTGDDMDIFLIWERIHPKLPAFFQKATKIYGDSLPE